MEKKCYNGTSDGDTAYFLRTDEQSIPECDSTIPGQYIIGHDMGDRPTGEYVDYIPQRIDSERLVIIERVADTVTSKTCEYCGSVNAPDARRCCGCQHAI